LIKFSPVIASSAGLGHRIELGSVAGMEVRRKKLPSPEKFPDKFGIPPRIASTEIWNRFHETVSAVIYKNLITGTQYKFKVRLSMHQLIASIVKIYNATSNLGSFENQHFFSSYYVKNVLATYEFYKL
jgi:hypothetical protein